VVCADVVVAETGAPDEFCPPGMRANALCILSADFCACVPVVACAGVAGDFCASVPVVACATAVVVETGAPDESCPPDMRANAVYMLSADFCACTPVVTCATAVVDFCASVPVVACATAAVTETGAPDESCPPGMLANTVCMFSAT